MNREHLTTILFIMIIAMAFSFAAMIVGFMLGLILLLTHEPGSPMFIMSIIGSTIFNALWMIFDRLYDKWRNMEKDEKKEDDEDDDEL